MNILYTMYTPFLLFYLAQSMVTLKCVLPNSPKKKA